MRVSGLDWGAVVVVALGTAAAGGSLATSGADFEIAAGPSAITDEERALVADPSRGLENALILMEETERHEDLNRITYHLRVKILSTEGRSLGNVEIPYDAEDGDVRDWWGKTILPDGTVIELAQDQLHRQVVVSNQTRRIVHVKGVLPGVVTGSVIDYGYTYIGNLLRLGRIDLEQRLPVKEFRYRWVAHSRASEADIVLRGAEGLDVSVVKRGKSVLIIGKNFPPLEEEPRMPPVVEAYSAAYPTYGESATIEDWDDTARRLEDRTKRFLAKPGTLKEVIAGLSMPPDADLQTKARVVYNWIGDNITNRSLRTVEEVETESERKENDASNTAAHVLQSRQAWASQLDLLFIGFIRALGGRAYNVGVANRTIRGSWDPGTVDRGRLTDGVVAVGTASDAPETFTLSDPGSGLPYGQIPWWYTGGKGLLALNDHARAIEVRPSPPDQNLANTTMTITFPNDASLHMVWTRTLEGQQGYSERRALRQSPPEERRSRIDKLCGASSRFELSQAAAPNLDTLTAPLTLVCEGNYGSKRDDPDLVIYRYVLDGVWLDASERFTAPKRRYPIVFPFAKTDRQSLDVHSPPGFEPRGKPPADVSVTSPFGSYSLTFSTDGASFHIERTATLSEIWIPPSQYEAFRTFLAKIARADASVLEFQKGIDTHP